MCLERQIDTVKILLDSVKFSGDFDAVNFIAYKLEFPMPTLMKTRTALFWFLCLSVALVSWRFIPLGVAASMDFMLYHMQDRPIALFAHIGLAPVALFVMPFQFSTRLRAKRPGLHRWMGRIYGISIVLAAVAGLSLAMTTEAGSIAAVGFGLLAIVWLATTVWAVWLAMTKRIALHKRWMIRSGALTFAAVTLRLYLPILAMTFGFETGYSIVAWLCWVPNLLIAELWLLPRYAPLRTKAA